MIAIIDYGMGNIHSVQKALESLGSSIVVVGSAEDVLKADKLVLPGVGAFDDAMNELENKGLVKPILDYVLAGKPFLGICLGLQLFFEKSQEAQTKKGLGIIPGEVVRFSAESGLKVPHMGWNGLCVHKKECPILEGVRDSEFVYFCHCFYVLPSDRSVSAAQTEYGTRFTSIVWRDNIYGVQFHPEKSQQTGMKILRNFVHL